MSNSTLVRMTETNVRQVSEIAGDPGRIRTCDLQLRRLGAQVENPHKIGILKGWKSAYFGPIVIPPLSRRNTRGVSRPLSRGLEMARQTLTDLGVAKLKPKAKRYNHADPNLPGIYVRVTPTGAKTFAAIVRNPSRQAGADHYRRCRDAADRRIAGAGARRHAARQGRLAGLPAAGRKLRRRRRGLAQAQSRGRKTFDRCPRSGASSPRTSCRSGTIWKSPASARPRSPRCSTRSRMRCGARQADWCLTVIRMILRWHASRVDGYNPPLFIGMRRQSPKKQRRSPHARRSRNPPRVGGRRSERHLRRAYQDADPDRAAARQGPDHVLVRSDRRQDHVENPHRIAA